MKGRSSKISFSDRLVEEIFVCTASNESKRNRQITCCINSSLFKCSSLEFEVRALTKCKFCFNLLEVEDEKKINNMHM